MSYNKLFKVAEFIERKYLFSKASNLSSILDDIKSELITAFNLYVNDSSPVTNPYLKATSGLQINKDAVIPTLASLKEHNCKYILNTMKKMIENIQDIDDPSLLYIVVNKILDKINNAPEIKNYIRDISNLNKEVDRNFRAALIAKFENTAKRLSSILDKQLNRLNKLSGLKEKEDKTYHPPIAELTRGKLYKFMLTPLAQELGLTDFDVLEKALEYPNMKDLLTKIINAYERGHHTRSESEFKYNLDKIKEWYDETHEKLNTKYFEQEDSGDID